MLSWGLLILLLLLVGLRDDDLVHEALLDDLDIDLHRAGLDVLLLLPCVARTLQESCVSCRCIICKQKRNTRLD